METRVRIHQLVDELSESDLDDVVQFLEDRRPSNALARLLANAPVDDETESPEETAAMRRRTRILPEIE